MRGFTVIEMDGCSRQIDWTPTLGFFEPFTLMYFQNIVHLDVSGCNTMNPADFVDCIQFVPRVQTVVMDSCNQFSQYHFVKLFAQIRNCENISLVQCQMLPFTPVYCILASLKCPKFLDFEAANIDGEKKDWRQLIAIFFKVKFGKHFTSKIKEY